LTLTDAAQRVAFCVERELELDEIAQAPLANVKSVAA
jgi:hypothetical protein